MANTFFVAATVDPETQGFGQTYFVPADEITNYARPVNALTHDLDRTNSARPSAPGKSM